MEQMQGGRMSPHAGMTMKAMVKSHIGAMLPSPSSNLPTVLDPRESQRNYAITARLNEKNFMGNVITRVQLPHDVRPGASPEDAGEDVRRAQEQRAKAQWYQIAMPWFSSFMPDPGEAGRLNNPGMEAHMKQRQLAPPNTYGQFYAFMRAMSAAFGSVQGG